MDGRARWRFYAMDTAFWQDGMAYSADARFAMLAELGYDGAYLTLGSRDSWSDLARLRELSGRHGVEVAGVHVGLEVGPSGVVDGGRPVRRLIDEVGSTCVIDVALRTPVPVEDPDGGVKQAVVPALSELAAQAAASGARLSLYPHVGFWMQRVEEAVELASAVASPALGVTFSAYHWHATDGTDVDRALGLARAHLANVNICGVSGAPGSGFAASIHTLDSGTLDNFLLLGAIRRTGYEGWIGLQGYSVAGDVYANLNRSLAAYRSMTDRLDRHPEWAQPRSAAGD